MLLHPDASKRFDEVDGFLSSSNLVVVISGGGLSVNFVDTEPSLELRADQVAATVGFDNTHCAMSCIPKCYGFLKRYFHVIRRFEQSRDDVTRTFVNRDEQPSDSVDARRGERNVINH